jgi:hypothetical protein
MFNKNTFDNSQAKQVRQGDIFLRPVDPTTIPDNYVLGRPGRAIVAHGEVTGHKHVVMSDNAQWLTTATEDINLFARTGDQEKPLYLFVPEDSGLVHNTHTTLPVTTGVYEVVRKRQYAPKALPRPVVD